MKTESEFHVQLATVVTKVNIIIVDFVKKRFQGVSKIMSVLPQVKGTLYFMQVYIYNTAACHTRVHILFPALDIQVSKATLPTS